MKFLKRLREELNKIPFNPETARALSLQIHDAEKMGYDISNLEDRLWNNLTGKLEEIA